MQDWPPAPELSSWVKKQRVAHAQGTLTEERLQILCALGFEFGGDGAQLLTTEWELNFDLLMDWLLWQVAKFLLDIIEYYDAY